MRRAESAVPDAGAFRDRKTIGFFSRICADKGLHLLVEALHAMSEAGNVPPYRLRVAGYLDRPDRAYLDEIRKRVDAWGMADHFEYVGELDRAGKIAFLESLDVLCLPSMIRESKGLPVLEAWASGVPAVLPDHGAFSEMIADTGAGCSTIRTARRHWRRPWAACWATTPWRRSAAGWPSVRFTSVTRPSASRARCWPCMKGWFASRHDKEIPRKGRRVPRGPPHGLVRLAHFGQTAQVMVMT